MQFCAAFNCLNKGVHFFPKDIELWKLWEEALKRNNSDPGVWSKPKLCSAHFTPDDYYECGDEYEHRILKKTAVPSIFVTNEKRASSSAQKLPEIRKESEKRPETCASDNQASRTSNGAETDSLASATKDPESDCEKPNLDIRHCYECTTCRKPFRSYCLLFRHQITHKNYCTVCRRSFRAQELFKNHVCYVCDICNQSFSNGYILKYHRQFTRCQVEAHRRVDHLRHEENCQRCLSCPDCSETFTSPTELREHVVKSKRYRQKIKKGRKYRHFCSVCGQGFQESFELMAHMRQHNTLNATVRSYSRAKRPLTGAVGRITNSNETQEVVTDDETDSKMGINVNPKVQRNWLEMDVKKEPEEIQINKEVTLQDGDIVVNKATGDQLDIVQRICSEWSDVKEEIVELEMVKQEPEEC